MEINISKRKPKLENTWPFCFSFFCRVQLQLRRSESDILPREDYSPGSSLNVGFHFRLLPLVNVHLIELVYSAIER